MEEPLNNCETRKEDYFARKVIFETTDLKELQIPADCKIFRMVSKLDKKDRKYPDLTCFSDKGLSVVITGFGLPDVDIERVFLEDWKPRDYVGVWEIPKEIFPEQEYSIHHDPFPYYDKTGKTVEQKCKNHAQIFCNKGLPKSRQVKESGSWIIQPDTN